MVRPAKPTLISCHPEKLRFKKLTCVIRLGAIHYDSALLAEEISFVANSPQEGRESATKRTGWDHSRSH